MALMYHTGITKTVPDSQTQSHLDKGWAIVKAAKADDAKAAKAKEAAKADDAKAAKADGDGA